MHLGGDIADTPEGAIEWLEFHDSTLLAIQSRHTHVELQLDGYVHRWQQLRDGWKGTGWMRRVRIEISEPMAFFAGPPLPVDISDGGLQLDGVAPTDGLRLPFEASGRVGLWLQLITADVLDVTGRAVLLEGVGPARYVEDLPVDSRPRRV